MNPEISPQEPVHSFPGGEKAPAYRWAFLIWMILFLGTLLLGFLNYFGILAKRWEPNL